MEAATSASTAGEVSKHEKMARWQRLCILRETARDFNLALANADHPAVNHAANQRDYILTELPPPVAAAINAEVRSVLHREYHMLPPTCLIELHSAVEHEVCARLDHQVHATCTVSALGTTMNFSWRCDYAPVYD